jgi:hypothetical protein
MNLVPIPDQQQSAEDNRFLEGLNALLEEPELQSYRDLEERFPTVHVVGLPRSGTTISMQLLAAHTDLAYTDHVAAAFWRAPATGLRLSESLRRHVPRSSAFESDYGRTTALTEPHEFSYFWSRLLGTPFGLASLVQPEDPESVDWPFVRLVLLNMCDAVGRPLVFKSFWTIWYLEALCRTLPKTVVVVVHRDPLAVARSLVKMREQLYGSRDVWASMKPREYSWLKDTDYATQIAGQIRYVNRAIDEGVRHVANGALVEVTYEDVCRDPAAFIENVVGAVASQGGAPRIFGAPQPLRASSGPSDADVDTELARALAEFDARESQADC